MVSQLLSVNDAKIISIGTDSKMVTKSGSHEGRFDDFKHSNEKDQRSKDQMGVNPVSEFIEEN